jgi:uncharacterized protein (DUF1810 family)
MPQKRRPFQLFFFFPTHPNRQAACEICRLGRCTRLVTLVEGRTIRQILGAPDDLKFRSSMTLFAHAAADAAMDPTDFNDAMKKYFNSEPDPLTVELLL